MDLIHNLSIGFGVAFTFTNLLYCLLGCILGTLIGVLPGIGPVATIAMLLPATYALPPVSALIMLAGIYYGAQYGGSTTAILVNLPGESSSVVTCIDGYQMARQGRAGPALAAAGLGSFFAGCVGTLILAAFAPPPGRMPRAEPSAVPRSTAGIMRLKSSLVGHRPLTLCVNTSRSSSGCERLPMISP